MSFKPAFISTKAEKKSFSKKLCMFCQEKLALLKKVEKLHKTLNLSTQDYQNRIECNRIIKTV